ncbi:hypothetical protein [Kribbella sp. NPDC051620]|uniref:hypothetical protein n=1 Tax=Kribbella sp. NPDC051620 TaxID=3364120 RepID=UPI00379AF6C5
MTDQLKDRFAVLTDDRPEPADPVLQVRQSIGQRRRRRTGLAVIACATATAAAVLAVPAVRSLQSATDRPGVASSPSKPTLQPSKPSQTTPPESTDHHRVLPAPWSDEVLTMLPGVNPYPPHKQYYIAKGRVANESWDLLVYSRQGCLVADQGPVSRYPHYCFGRSGRYAVNQLFLKADATMLFGAAPIDARAVKVQAGGKTYIAPAVATPATDTTRFFALTIPGHDLKITSVTPVDKTGKPVGAALLRVP